MFLHPLQLLGVVFMEDVCELADAILKTSVPSLFVLLGQLDPGLQSDGESGLCGMFGDVCGVCRVGGYVVLYDG